MNYPITNQHNAQVLTIELHKTTSTIISKQKIDNSKSTEIILIEILASAGNHRELK